jgi:hypothetical protein
MEHGSNTNTMFNCSSISFVKSELLDLLEVLQQELLSVVDRGRTISQTKVIWARRSQVLPMSVLFLSSSIS